MAELCVLSPLRIEAAAARRGASFGVVERTGMGPSRSATSGARLAGALPRDAPVAVTGLCGGLDPELAPGDVVVADELWTADGRIRIDLPGAALVAAALARDGRTVRRGPLLGVERLVTGQERSQLATSGAVAVDMESPWLAAPLLGNGSRPLAVVRVVSDAAGHELGSTRAARNVIGALRVITAIVPTLEAWAGVVAPRDLKLAAPRSFCAGVDRAIDIVERALDRHQPPIYVRRQIIHNTHVVRDLEQRGAVFVQEVEEVPPGSLLVFAAHGVSPEVRRQATMRDLQVIDATCPLVAKVHAEARRFADRDHDIVLVGHRDHEEVEGTVGEAPDRITVVASTDEVDTLVVDNPERVAYLTQTTLAVGETQAIVERIRSRFPALVGPRSDDICYATQNRQEAVEAIAPHCDLVLVVGSPNSSNSKRLVEVATAAGSTARLIDEVDDLRLEWLDGARTVGITAGASAPEDKVQEVVAAIASIGPVTVEEHVAHEETVTFRLPQEVR